MNTSLHSKDALHCIQKTERIHPEQTNAGADTSSYFPFLSFHIQSVRTLQSFLMLTFLHQSQSKNLSLAEINWLRRWDRFTVRIIIGREESRFDSSMMLTITGSTCSNVLCYMIWKCEGTSVCILQECEGEN